MAQGIPAESSFLHSPLISNVIKNATPEQLTLLQELLADFVENNPVINKHLTAWEMTDYLSEAPILTDDVVQKMTEQARDRGPLNEYQDMRRSATTSLLETVDERRSDRFANIIKAGTTQPRDCPGKIQMCTTSNFHKLRQSRESMESLLFPYMFPSEATFKGKGGFRNYSKMRMQQMFSLHTYFPQYVLYLYQINKAMAFKNTVQVCLDTEYKKFKKAHPDASSEEAFNSMLKQPHLSSAQTLTIPTESGPSRSHRR